MRNPLQEVGDIALVIAAIVLGLLAVHFFLQPLAPITWLLETLRRLVTAVLGLV